MLAAPALCDMYILNTSHENCRKNDVPVSISVLNKNFFIINYMILTVLHMYIYQKIVYVLTKPAYCDKIKL